MNEEILDCIDGAISELERVEIRYLPDDQREDFAIAHGLLTYISMVLEKRLKTGEWND